MTKVQVINEDKTVETIEVDPENLLEELQDLVGGYVQKVPSRKADEDGYIVLCDEEGEMNRKQMNEHASELFGQTLLGPVVLIGQEDFV